MDGALERGESGVLGGALDASLPLVLLVRAGVLGKGKTVAGEGMRLAARAQAGACWPDGAGLRGHLGRAGRGIVFLLLSVWTIFLRWGNDRFHSTGSGSCFASRRSPWVCPPGRALGPYPQV